MDKREKRLEDRRHKLDGREFDIVEGEKRLDEKKAREAAVAGMFVWEGFSRSTPCFSHACFSTTESNRTRLA